MAEIDCCFDLETGGYVIGFLHVMASLVTFVYGIYVSKHNIEIKFGNEGEEGFLEWMISICNIDLGCMIMILGIIWLVSTMTLFIGIHKVSNFANLNIIEKWNNFNLLNL